jgi:6-phosphogluconate dehydrogenase
MEGRIFMNHSTHCGIIGLGRMGAAAAQNLIEQGCRVVVTDLDSSQIKTITDVGAVGAPTIEELVKQLPEPRVIWLMVPAGAAVDAVCFGEGGLSQWLGAGDIVIDGGNSFYKDAIRRADQFKECGVRYLDCGSSGGLEGARHGLCLMIGGDHDGFEQTEWLFKALALPNGGYQYVGPSGAGHFVKMVHNAIEYGVLQAMGEGFELLDQGPYDINMAQVAGLWNQGSVIRSWLMELMEEAFKKDENLSSLSGIVGGGSTGSWAIEEAWKAGVPFATIAASYAARLRTRQCDTFSGKAVAALRHEFGGHPTVQAEGKACK